MNNMKKTLLITVLIWICTLSIIGYKLKYEPYIFDSRFGAQSIYDFDYSDAKHPFTVFYVKKGIDFSYAEGDYQQVNETLSFGGRNVTSVEWKFQAEKYLSAVWQAGGQLQDAALLISQPNPKSPENGTHVLMYVNNRTIASVILDVFADNYTWNIPLVWDIPGSNFAYPRHFAEILIPIDFINRLVDTNIKEPICFRIVLERNTDWKIDYVVLRLYNNYETLQSPWWRQNAAALSLVYLCAIITILLVAIWEGRKLLKKVACTRIVSGIRERVRHNSPVLLLFIVGISLRLALAIPNLWDWDITVYRGICTLSYSYGLDTRTFLSMYGPIWHGTLMAFYPVYLVLNTYWSLGSLANFVIKLPLVASDGVIAFLLFRIGKRVADENRARTLAACWLLNPYAIWMSSLWGIVHVIPTMFALLALERLIHGRTKSSACALSAAAFSGIYPIVALFLLPCFLVSVHKSLGKMKALEFFSLFSFCSAILAFPWPFSIAIFSNTLQGPGRVAYPALSYSYVVIPPSLLTYSSMFLLLLSSFSLAVYLIRKKSVQLNLQVNQYIFICFLLPYLSYSLVFPTYVLWSLPFLLIMYFCAHKVPFSYVILFMLFPVLWILYWGPIGWISGQGTEVFRDVFGLNFSALCMLIIMKLAFADSNQKNLSSSHNARTSILTRSTQLISVISCIFIVFAPWIQLPVWVEYWNHVFEPFFFALSMSLLAIVVIRDLKILTDRKMAHTLIHKPRRIQLVPLALLVAMWSYNMTLLLSDYVFPSIHNSFPILFRFQGDVYFPMILIMLLPTIIYDIISTHQNMHASMIAWIAFLQIDYSLTRHFEAYATRLEVPFILDLPMLTTMFILLLFMTLYQSKLTK
jgi:hypothetical protein